MTGIKLSLLGPPVVELDGQAIHLETRKATALLAYVCLSPQAVPREVLANLFWPDFDPQHTLANLRRCLSSINHSLQGGLLLSTAGAVGISDQVSLELDIHEFHRQLAASRSHSHPEDVDCPDCLAPLERAAELYRGEFLSGLNLPDCPDFDEWQYFQRESLRQELAGGLERLAGLYAASFEWEPAIAHARRWVSLDRLHEPAQRRLIQLYLQSDQRSTALRQYDEFARLLQEELGQSPAEETRLLVSPAALGPKPTGSGTPVSASPPLQSGLPVLKTKLFIPTTRPTVVPRQRLVERIDQGVQGPLTLVSAPAGYGKTTLLVEWAEHSSLPIAWFSVDGGDNDAARFLTYLIASLDSLFEGVGRDGLLLLRSSPSTSHTAVITRVIKDLEAVVDPFVQILDDYQFIHAQPVHDILTFLLENMPPCMHLLIASRLDPPLPLSRLRARQHLVELRANDLRLVPEEAGQFLNQVMGLNLGSEDLTTLETRTEGWAVGLQMAALALQGAGESRSRFIQSFSGSHRYVLDYLVDEVLSHQPEAIQQFLLQTSILERMCGELCDAVVESREWRVESSDYSPLSTLHSREILDHLDRSNLFLIPLDDERYWYRYHHLFADLLHSRLKRSAPEQEKRLHERASHWFEREGIVDEAVQHALAAKNTERAVELIRQHGMNLVANGEFTTLQYWFDTLPPTVFQQEAWLCIAQAWIWVEAGRVQDVEPLLDQAERLIPPDAPDARSLRGISCLTRAELALMEGDWERAIDLCRSAEELLPEDSAIHRWLLTLLMGDAHFITGDIARCSQAYQEACVRARKTNSTFLMIASWNNLAMAYRFQGRLHDAARAYQEAIRLAVEWGGPQTIFAGEPRIGYSNVLYEWNDLDGARWHAEDGIRGADQVIRTNPVVQGYIALGKIYQAQGDPERAGQMIEKADLLTRSHLVFPHTTSQLRAARIRHQLATGTLGRIPNGTADTVMRDDVYLRLPTLIEQTAQARIRVALGEAERAQALLARLAEFAQAKGLIQCLIEIELLLARLGWEHGRMAESLEIIEKCLTRAEAGGYLRTVIDEGPPVLEIIQEYRNQILTGRRKVPPNLWDYLERIASVFQASSRPVPPRAGREV